MKFYIIKGNNNYIPLLDDNTKVCELKVSDIVIITQALDEAYLKALDNCCKDYKDIENVFVKVTGVIYENK